MSLKQQWLIGGVTLAFIVSLSACGDDGGNKVSDSAESDIVTASFDDLPVCSDKRERVIAYVKDEKTAYICEDGNWIPEGSDKGKSSSSKGKFSSSSESKQGTSVKTIKDKSISGVTQKGPFVTGSAVKLYELDGTTYAQTGKSFTGKIASDDGEFSVANVTLASQYALLEVTGYFRNEVTGEKSRGTVTLNALTDLNDREKVNVNLLTHLEYERALYLVGKGVDVLSAKKQAEAEIFYAFGIRGEFENSEDLDIFSKGDGNAALLAFSVLMLRDLSEADLTELLTKFAIDIEKDGKWDDEATKAKIADWAQKNDLYDADAEMGMQLNSGWGLAAIRSNIEAWNLGIVPEFEKYMRNFWYANYGLGECDSKNKGVVATIKNELSASYGTKVRFICKSGAWVEANDIEKDFYESEKNNGGEDGELWVGLVTGDVYKYDEELGGWKKNDTLDEILNKACTAKRVGLTESDEQGNKYYCMANGWESLMGWNWKVSKNARLNPDIGDYGAMTDPRDGKKYKTISIGMQIWMAENLNYADSATTTSLKGKSWCYNDEAANCDVAGRLYTWAAAMDSVNTGCGYGDTCKFSDPVQGICPSGWHLPSYDEWNTLFIAVGGSPASQTEHSSTAGKMLKSQSGWSDYNGKSANGTDAFGFAALPAGLRGNYGAFYDAGVVAAFWSSTEINNYYVSGMDLHYDGEFAFLGSEHKDYGLPVRCLKD